jgi:hypothetical protein
MREVDLTQDLLPRHKASLRGLEILSRRVSSDNWCLVGGMMVLTASRDIGRTLPRAEQTKDVDVVVDICADAKILANVAWNLQQAGYEIPPEAWDNDNIARCTFFSNGAQIDVLCPDDSNPADLDIEGSIRSLAIPGGRRALQLSESVRIRYSEDAADVELRVPLLMGAIVVKGHAMVDPRTSNQSRHGEDLVGLLSIIEDPIEARASLASEDLNLIVEIEKRFSDNDHQAWISFEPEIRLRVQAALAILCG